MSLDTPHPDDYATLLAELKARVRATQVRAARAANTEILHLYWTIGHDILTRQRTQGWGAKIVERLAQDLAAEFPDQRGWSRTNLLYMRKFAEAWPTWEAIVPHAVGQLPWSHVRLLLDSVASPDDRDWYAGQDALNGWSRAVLHHHITTGLRQRAGAAPNNFDRILDPADSDQARELIRDPYVFDHLGLTEPIREKDLERSLTDQLQATLQELGAGMAFVGRQVRLTITDPDGTSDQFAIDLLFFHVEQLRYIVIELKTRRYEPAFMGQLQTYVAIVDDQLRRPAHNPTVGILICAGRNDATVRYSLATTGAPIAVAGYTSLPPDIRTALPSPDQLTASLHTP